MSHSGSAPNVVLITADNQPASLLGCYGNSDVHTPAIDRMAAEGLRFPLAFSTNGMCSPGRASIFTGLMPSTHGVHNWLDDHFLQQWPRGWCAVSEFRTLAGALSAAGYRTAMIGKYHLGHPDTAMPGFDDWIAFATGHTVDFYDNVVVEEGRRVHVKDTHIVDYFTDKTTEWLESVETSRPFFLNVNFDAPYLLPPANLGPDRRNRHYARFEGAQFSSFPRTAIADGLLARIDGPDDIDNFYRHHLYGYLRMHNDPATMANVCAQISTVDDAVGRILGALQAGGLDRDTVVIFTADQSNLYGQHGLWGHTMDTDPAHLYEAGLHIPLLVWAPGRVPAGSVDDRFVSQVDLAPTLLHYLGLDATFADSPGRSFAQALTDPQGADRGNWEDVVYVEQEESRGIRTPEYSYWKRLQGVGQPVLFDLRADPDEENDVAADPAYASVCELLDARLSEFFERYADPRFDLWKGGRAKGSVRKVDLYKRLYGTDWAPVAEVTPTYVEVTT